MDCPSVLRRREAGQHRVDFVKVYVNRTAAGQPKNMPQGLILIKENFGGDKKTLMAITVSAGEGHDVFGNEE